MQLRDLTTKRGLVGILLIWYIIFQPQMPNFMYSFLAWPVGKIALVACIITIFMKDKILGVLSILTGILMLYSVGFSIFALKDPNYLGSEEANKWQHLPSLRSLSTPPYSLELEMIKRSIPNIAPDITTATFHPMHDDSHNAGSAYGSLGL